MALLYERRETLDKIIIRYKYWPFFYILIIVFFVLFYLVRYWLFVNLLVAIFALVFIVAFWKPNQEIRKAMKEGNVQVSGSKFSFSNPFTAVIKKKK